MTRHSLPPLNPASSSPFARRREHIGSLDVTATRRGAMEEHQINAAIGSSANLEPVLRELEDYFRERWCSPVALNFFGSVTHAEYASRLLKHCHRLRGAPLNWLQGDSCQDDCLTGLQCHAVGGTPLTPIRHEDTKVGYSYEDDQARYCVLTGIVPSSRGTDRQVQTRRTFDLIDALLHQAGMTFLDVVRTWIYLEDLLDWYDDFNEARTGFFTDMGVFTHRVPASTGIGAANHRGTPLTVNVLAARALSDDVRIDIVPSPLQCPALEYCSSFSRAMEVSGPHWRRLLISGTASIHPNGDSAHLDDPAAQIDLTLRVVQAILESRGLGYEEVQSAILYFRHAEHIPLFSEQIRRVELPCFPRTVSHAVVCRNELLFEMELDAIAGV